MKDSMEATASNSLLIYATRVATFPKSFIVTAIIIVPLK